MPSRNTVKQYLENSFYHVYNRGVERRRIFLDDQDYRVFLHLLKFYLSKIESFSHPLSELTGFSPTKLRPLKNLEGEVEVICYCLMPNHFHLLIRQKPSDGMKKLMHRILTTYSLYFNRRYDRVGTLFQGRYKAALVDKDEYLLHLSRYIHQNPTLTKPFLDQYPYSSYTYYLEGRGNNWLNPSPILDYFKAPENPLANKFSSYRDFIESLETEPEEILGKLTIEKD